MLKPLLIVFLTSIILTYLFYPLYRKIRKPLRFQGLSIFITLILIIIIILMPFAFVASQIPGQISHLYDYVKGKSFDLSCENNNGILCGITNLIGNLEFLELDSAVNNVFKGILQLAADVVKSIPGFVISIAFALFISFFLFKDGERLAQRVVEIMPLDRKSSSKLVEQFGKVTHSVVFAHLIVALVQGALGATAFFIFGIPSALFWGVVMAIFALLPVIGPAIIWVPASLFLILNGVFANSYFMIGKGIGLVLFGLFVISTIDNILRVKLVGDSGEVHPLTVLIGLIGGVNLFGLMGIFIGPILLSLLVTYLKDFSKRYKGG